MKDIRTAITTIRRATRIRTRLESMGVTVKYNRRLMKMTNIQTVWGGHLKDAKMHYRSSHEVSGNTYPVRDILKADGFRWDSSNKVWYTGQYNIETGAKIIRRMENKLIEA